MNKIIFISLKLLAKPLLLFFHGSLESQNSKKNQPVERNQQILANYGHTV